MQYVSVLVEVMLSTHGDISGLIRFQANGLRWLHIVQDPLNQVYFQLATIITPQKLSQTTRLHARQ